MSQSPYERFDPQQMSEPRRRGGGVPWWGWLLIILGGGLLLTCGSCVGLLAWFGSVSPEASIYAGNRVPAAYLDEAKALNLLEDDEKVLWFYSDALTDIKDGMYFVTDQKLVIYNQNAGSQPDTVITFDRITDADLDRDTSFFVDSTITLTLDDGSIVSFPVSSEYDRDEDFYNAIRTRMPAP